MAVKWYGDKVLLKLRKDATPDMIDAAALLLEGEIKIQIQANGQIDTGFMTNSVYSVTSKTDGYGAAQGAAKSQAPEKEMSPKANPPQNGGVVATGAEYAVYQELRLPFMYPALEKVAAMGGGDIVKAGQGAMND